MKQKDPLIFIEHILDSIKNIEIFSKGIKKEELSNNIEKQSAIVRQIEIIGEAIKNIPSSFKKKYPEVSWKEIVGTRDILIHHYFGVDLNIIWDITNKDLPELKQEILKIKKDLNKES